MAATGNDRLILLMLCEIYEKLGIDGEIDPAFVKSAIFNDQTWGLSWRYTGIYPKAEEAPEAKEVSEILEMWRHIEFSHQQLSANEKEQVKREAAPYGEDVAFPGFDGNNDARQISIAEFLVNDLQRFQELKGRNLDAHSAGELDRYKRMLPVYRSLRSVLAQKPFSASELISILKPK